MRNKLQVLTGLAVIVCAVTLAIIVGSRLSDEALGVLAGAVCGVGSAIPTSLIIVAVSRRRSEPYKREMQPSVSQQRRVAYPPVIVVSPQSGQQWPNNWNSGPYGTLPPSLTAPVERNFTVVGGTSVSAEVTGYDYERCS